jgi:hypothetical protein
MSRTISVSIPTPCGEQWNSFTPTTTGGFCGSCQKNVIDFTNATEDEIMAFISRKPAHVCGRFRSDQLKTYSYQPLAVRPGLVLLKAGVASMFLLLSKPSFAEAGKEPLGITLGMNENQSGVLDSLREIHGVVRDSSQQVLSGVSIYIAGTAVGTSTDQHGRYSLLIPSTGTTLTYSYIGFKTQHIIITDQYSVDIVLNNDPVMLEEITIHGTSSSKRTDIVAGLIILKKEFWLKRLVRQLKEVFQS